MSEMFIGSDLVENSRITLNRDDLSTHALVVGRTGSGKTGLVHVLIEEAVMQGTSAVILDPKGDLTNLMLAFPGLTPSEFAPWVPAGKSASDEAQKWSNGLENSGQSPDRVLQWRNSASFRTFTPGHIGGKGINLLPSLAKPEIINSGCQVRAQHIVTTVLTALGISADPLTDARSVFLTELLMLHWNSGRDLPLDQWPGLLSQPPVELTSFDGISLDDFFPRKDRMKLASAIVGFRRQASRWLDGAPMDFNELLLPGADGRPKVSIFTLRHLSAEDRMLFTAMFLSGLVDWMFQAPASGRLRALCVLDEAAGYIPPAPLNPPTKHSLCTLLAQGRAQGLGVLLATQNPNDIDYKALNNVGTWFLGGLRDRDMKRDLETELRDREVDINTLLRLPERSFMVLTKDRKSIPIKVRWTLSYLRGPIDLGDLGRLANDLEVVEEFPQLSKVISNPIYSDVIVCDFTLTDGRSKPVWVKVMYSTDNGKIWETATSYNTTNSVRRFTTSPEGMSHQFEWDSVKDLGRRYVKNVLLRIQPESCEEMLFPPFDVCNVGLEV